MVVKMFSLAWDNSKKLYSSFNVDWLKVKEKKQEFYNLDYRAKINDRVFQIKAKLQSREGWVDENLKEAVIEVADQINELLVENEEKNVFTVTCDGHTVQAYCTSRNQEKSSLSERKFSPLSPFIRSFSADALMDVEEIKRIKDIFESKITQPDLKSDLERFLTALSKEGRVFSQPRKVSTKVVQNCIESFQNIDDSKSRDSIIKIVEELRGSDWLPCMLMILEQEKPAKLSSWTSLLAGCRDSSELFQELSRRGVNFRTKDPEHDSTLLITAISRGFEKLAKAIIRSSDEEHINAVNNDKEFALAAACRQGNKEIVRKLLKIKEIGNLLPSLMIAINQGDGSIVKELLSLEAIDVNNADHFFMKTPLELAISKNHVEIWRELLKKDGIDLSIPTRSGISLIEMAFLKRDSSILEEILRRPNVDFRPIFSMLETNPKNAAIPPMGVLSHYFKKECEDFFSAHPGIKIMQLILQGREEEAQQLLNKTLASEKVSDIFCLMETNEELDPFIEKNTPLICKWLIDHQILENLPQSKQIIVLSKLYPNCYKFMDRAGTLAQKGIAIVMEYLKNKGSLPKDQHLKLCQDRTAFADALIELTQDEIQDGEVRLFLVNKFDENPYGVAGHVTPLFFKRVEEAWEIIITDSTTDFSNCDKMDSSCAPLVEHILETEKHFIFNVKCIHVNTYWRQTDSINCFVFGIRDLINFSRDGDQFLSDLQSTKQKVHYFTDLPVSWMKTTQSVKEIENYAEAKKRAGVSLVMHRKKGKNDETLLENLARNTKKATDGSNHKWNSLIEKRSTKYKQIVIDQLIKKLRKIYTA